LAKVEHMSLNLYEHRIRVTVLDEHSTLLKIFLFCHACTRIALNCNFAHWFGFKFALNVLNVQALQCKTIVFT